MAGKGVDVGLQTAFLMCLCALALGELNQLQEKIVLASDGADWDLLGFHMKIAGDVNGDGFTDFVAGAHYDDDNGDRSGSAYVLCGDLHGSLVECAKLVASDGRAGSEFGFAVSSAGDINGDGFDDIVVGAYYHGAGSAYVFCGDRHNNFTECAILAPSNPMASGRFGYAATAVGDINGDGFDDIAVSSASGANTVNVFCGDQRANMRECAIMSPSDGRPTWFGSFLVAGDINGDGCTDIVVGDRWKSNLAGTQGGGVHVFCGDCNANFLECATFDGSDTAAFDNFGVGLSVGDVNADGFVDIVVGAHSADSDLQNIGRVYVFCGGDDVGTVTECAKLEASMPSASDYFGSSTAVGDVNGDGFADIVVGALGTDQPRNLAGSLYVFCGDHHGNLTECAHLVTSGPISTEMGSTVNVVDINRDGLTEIVSSSPSWNAARYGSEDAGGSVHIFWSNASTPTPMACPTVSECSAHAYCRSSAGNATCVCKVGFEDVHGDGSVCRDIDECQIEATASQCHFLASCENRVGSFGCVCPSGFIGDGTDCVGNAFGVRSVFAAPDSARRAFSEQEVQAWKLAYARLLTDAGLAANSSLVIGMPIASGIMHYGGGLLDVLEDDGDGQITLIALFEDEDTATDVTNALDGADMSTFWTLSAPDDMTPWTILDGPAVYRWVAPTTSAPQEINPSGLQVERVWFEENCLSSGCWKVEVTYTVGVDNFNVFYLPKTDGDDSLSYDQAYNTDNDDWNISPADTFLPSNHPCTTADYLTSTDPALTPASATACCIPGFLAMYRPVATFQAAISGSLWTALTSVCDEGNRDRGVTRTSIPIIAKRGQTVDESEGVYQRPIAPAIDGISGELFATEMNGIFTQGLFSGMAHSHINSSGAVDGYVGIYRATLSLDEVELRTMAGQLKGTPGVEHTVDTFVGLAEFSPTGSVILDPFATQINIHLEKTSFFTVSTHGTNDYTFLEYVNMRLVAIYNEDTDFSGRNESDARTVRTSSSQQINYVQVTFTLGQQYKVDDDPAAFPLIPLDSVRAGYGSFFAEDLGTLEHKCMTYNDTLVFDSDMLHQDCAPQAAMCVSPDSIPDSFVVFNIPLGTDYFEAAGGPSATLANNVFVDMVISAVEHTTGSPNAGDDPEQMKTTLTASIPIVEGGINIFCDGFTAKTDLKDVANADIVVGSASSADELTRLRIMKDITSTQLSEEAITRIDSDSIEAGLMTLVLKGNSSYFLANTGRSQVTLELEDVITIHIMEDDGAGRDDGTGKDGEVAALLVMPPDDNTDSNGLDVDGYKLNGAFWFWIDRSAQRAHLEPSAELLRHCPFNPPRPTPGASPLETCVVRRDVRYRGFPARTGAMSTAMELCTTGSATDLEAACPDADETTSQEAKFFSTIFGNSEYAKKLGSNYARIIADEYKLNNRYRRAYFINPGYEWTPTQTGGTPIFSVSQKLYLFALVTLDEDLTADEGELGADVTLPLRRRRMLLQSTPSNLDEALQDGESTVGGGVLEFQTTPSQLMAKAFEVQQDRVATFSVQLQLTQAEACMSDTELQGSIRATMEDYLLGSASPFHTVQITRMAVDRTDVQCARRSIRALQSSFSEATAEVTMLVVFEEGQDSIISLDKLAGMAGIESVAPLSVSPKVKTDAPSTYVPPPPSINGPAGNAGSDQPEGSSSNLAIIAGAAAGGAVLLIAAVVVFIRKSSKSDSEVLGAVQTFNVEDLKQQLAADA